MTVQNINPYIRYARYHENLALNDTLRYCYDCRLFFFMKGSCTLQINGEFFEISDNSAVYIPPATAYRFIFKDSEPHTVLVFDFDLVSEYSDIKKSLGTATEFDYEPEKVLKYQLPKEFERPISLTIPRLFETLKRCTDEFLNGEKYYREVTSAFFKMTLLDLLRESEAAAEFKVMPKVVEYIHRHYQDNTLTNEDIAREFNYHPYYLSQLMKKATGETLHNYLLQYRIRIAKNYLITTDLDINTVGWKCGFSSPSYFIKQFRAQTGRTPKQYRKTNVNTLP